MNRNVVSLSLLLLGIIHLVSGSSSYDYEPSKYHEEPKSVPATNYDQSLPGDDSSSVYDLTVPSLYSDDDGDNKKMKVSNNEEDSLNPFYYYQSCPEFESIVNRKIRALLDEDDTLLASLLRLHFHDCAVRGCDASILLNHEGSERNAASSKTLRGFEIIDEIKAEVEKKCPKIVSCADILTAAARDATVVSGGKYWTVDYGRKDGFVSKAEEADSLIPTSHDSVTDMIEKFQSLGLEIDDLVALSGAHTIGRSTCGSIQSWLYKKNETYSSTSMNEKYLDYLKRKCRWASDYVELDAKSPKYFDNEYYINLVYRKTGLLSTDRLLYSDSRTRYFVTTLAYTRSNFHQQFKKSMRKLGNVHVLTGPNEGQIRTHCSLVNSHY